jgi:hypothetical protein
MLEILDATSEKGISWYFRKRRMRHFLNYLDSIDKEHVDILDLGGTLFFWERLGLANSKKIKVVVLNLFQQTSPFTNMECVVGNVTDLNTFPKRNFDIVFSNSVIEHLFSYENQQKMATNIMSVSKRVFIQTPNYYFPIEPHFMFPCFQYLSKKLKMYLVSHFSLGSYPVMSDDKVAEEAVEEIKLLRPKQMRLLFPTLNIGFEKLLFVNKSIIAQNLY